MKQVFRLVPKWELEPYTPSCNRRNSHLPRCTLFQFLTVKIFYHKDILGRYWVRIHQGRFTGSMLWPAVLAFAHDFESC